MTEKPYATVLSTALALAGIPDSNAEEVARMGAFINLAAEKAYDESDQWPRWLRVEERVCSEDGLLPFEEDGKETIAVCRRIHATQPFARCGAVEYANYAATADGIQIAGYCPKEADGEVSMIVSGGLNPNAEGTFAPGGDYPFTAPDGITRPYYSSDGAYEAPAVGTWVMIYYSGDRWALTFWSDNVNLGAWESSATAALTPDGVTWWTPLIGTGYPVVTADTQYSIWVTYKAAMDVTYVTGSEVPAEWWKFMAYSAYAMFLRNDGQQEKAAMADQEAWGYLVPQLEKLDNQSGGHVYTRVVTTGNTQAR